MTSPINPLARPVSLAPASAAGAGRASAATSANFSDALRNAVSEVSRLQNDATSAVEQLQTGQTDDVTGVMTAVEKSELAFKTLLAIRGKLMTAYEEIRSMPI